MLDPTAVLHITTTTNMDYASMIFEDPYKFDNLISNGISILIMGNSLKDIDNGLVDLYKARTTDEGMEPCKLLFVFIKTITNMDDHIISLNYANANMDLGSCQTEHIGWLKLRDATKYPFECYYYSVTVDQETNTGIRMPTDRSSFIDAIIKPGSELHYVVISNENTKKGAVTFSATDEFLEANIPVHPSDHLCTVTLQSRYRARN